MTELISGPEIVIDTNKFFSFRGISIVNGRTVFYPSNYGGVCVINNKGELFQPWSDNIRFTKVSQSISKNSADIEWVMYKEHDFYYHYGISFVISGSSLKIHLYDMGILSEYESNFKYADVYSVLLDRCENAINPVVIGVPYLTAFNLLLANSCFTSMYFDWTKTNSSQIIPESRIFSQTSVFYSQYVLYNPLTNGRRNKLDETIYLKVSVNLDDVLPVLSNPVSKYKDESSKRIVFDDWDELPFVVENVRKLSEAGISNIWHIIHNDQRTNNTQVISFTYTAADNESYINNIIEYHYNKHYLYSFHENYCEVFRKSYQYNESQLSQNPNGEFIFNWYDEPSRDSSYLIKPDKIFENLIPYSENLHSLLKTNSGFHDVSSSYDPSKFVDYDYRSENAGKFSGPYGAFTELADSLRIVHGGPVSGEGLAHFMYVGYYDDICAQIHTAQSLPGSYYGQTEKLGGFYKPLLVNFDLLKMKEKATVHGLGYYERFFYNNNYWQYMGRSKDSALMYAATELAYGHGAFLSKLSYDWIEQGLIEYKYVYPVQLLYANSKPKYILYNDNGNLVTASQYIKKYPGSFDDFDNINFMSQVYIEYENGLKIFVNRNPQKVWEIDLSKKYGYFNMHSLIGNTDTLLINEMYGQNFILPKSNGWVCFKAL